MTELAEGARLEIVCAPKEYLGFEALSLRQIILAPSRRVSYGARPRTPRRGGRVVECGGLENRFTGNPGDEGSNPSSSASFIKQAPSGAFLFDRSALMVNRLIIILE